MNGETVMTNAMLLLGSLAILLGWLRAIEARMRVTAEAKQRTEGNR